MTATRKKRGHQTAKALSELDREKLRQTVLDWHHATCATLANLAGIASEMLEELSNCCSPLHEFFDQPNDLREFIGNVHDADSSLTFVLVRESLTTSTVIPNPCDMLRQDEK